MSKKILFLPILIFLLIGGCSYATKDVGRIDTTVELTRDSERVCRSSGESQSCGYEVYTDQGVFSNEDSIWHGKFNSGDLQASFVEGATCRITAVGFRIRVLSMRKNIIKADCVPPTE
ncbi:hypothetical protein [Candidatus Macondimonas diazotrophica]|jgi:hypothetical protein|uniref:Uncharacterized protein n=1 Tax=Candidatus Macondimonas diazotrophica TaxID=2305248 RepID=A0A4Z0F7F1_9GAMM|nr:hypothetical protein [Candidatus Macondimonas diazotrophica]TFZ81629.1 hypothetical protein E4680_11645 [Candidatus Macondimonas diazotrophica]